MATQSAQSRKEHSLSFLKLGLWQTVFFKMRQRMVSFSAGTKMVALVFR